MSDTYNTGGFPDVIFVPKNDKEQIYRMETNPSKSRAASSVRKQETSALIVVSMAVFVDMFLYGVTVPIIPSLATEYSLSSGNIGFLFGIYATVMILLTPLIGLWVDRQGSRPPLLIGLIGLAVSTIFFAYAPSFTLLVIARALQGASAAATWTAGLALLAAIYSKENRGAAMGTAFSLMSAGLLLGPPVGGFLFERFGRAIPFLICAGLVLIDLLLRIFLIRGIPHSPRELHYKELMRTGNFLPALFITVLGASLFAFIEPILPLHADRLFHASSSSIGLMFGAATLASLVFFPLAGMLSDRVNIRGVILLGVAISALSYALIALANNTWFLMAGMVLLAIGGTFILAPTTNLIGKTAETVEPPAYGSAYSLYNVSYSAGLAVAPMLAGVLNGFTSFSVTSLIMSGLILIGGALVFGYRKQ
ncbi:MAG: MFS transporter [Chloroflexi bacterium]|nr:MAG: MFS transporter [Chloroflexota bacterium]